MNSEQAVRELRRALQLVVQSLPIEDESQMMEYSSLYPTWEELLATKQTYPAGKVFRWGANSFNEPQLWKFISEYTPQEIYTPDQDNTHYKKIGVTDDGHDIWTQPLCAEDSYKVGDIVWHKDRLWTGDKPDAAGNIPWEPGIAGWKEYVGDTPGSDEVPAWETLSAGTVLNVGDKFTHNKKLYQVTRQLIVALGYEPPNLLNQFYVEIKE